METFIQTINHFVVCVTYEDAFPDTLEYLSSVGKSIISSLKFTVVEQVAYKFQPIGVTYTYILSQSHFTIHTWPEYKLIYFDIFSCSDLQETEVIKAINIASDENKIIKLEVRKIDISLPTP